LEHERNERENMRTYTDLVPTFPDQGDWTVATVLRHHAGQRPEAVFLDLPEEGLTLTYSETLARAESVADRLAEVGAQTGDRVLVMAANSSRFLLTWLGTGLGGTVEVPINTAYEGVFLEHQMVTAAPRWAVIDDVQAAKFLTVGEPARVIERFWVIDTGSLEQALDTLRQAGWSADPWDDLARGARPGAEFPAPQPQSLASIFFTSGTTGPSKGVAMPHAQMYFFGQEVVCLQRLSPDDVYFTCTPLFHGNAQFMAAYPALIAGARLVCRPKFSASRWVDHLRESRITATNLIGVMMDFVWKQPERPDDADNVLRTVFAAPTASSIVDGFRKRFGIEAFTEVFGLTETSRSSRPTARSGRPAPPG
jgi:carnitine-CoA ligase